MAAEKAFTITLTHDDAIALADLIRAEENHFERLILDGTANDLTTASMAAWNAQIAYWRSLRSRVLVGDQPQQLPDLARAGFSFRQRSSEEAA
jgi:hypothetical protein